MEAQIARVAGRQYGLITVAQLNAAGLSQRGIAHRCQASRLHRIHRGVYAVGHAAQSDDARCLAAVLAAGPDAALSHMSAAVLWGLLRPERSGHRPHVSVPRRLTQRSGMAIHWAVLQPSEITRQKRIPVTTPARTLIDLAAVVPANWLTRAVREAEVQRLVDISTLRVPPHVTGAQKLRDILDQGPAPTRSEFEDETLDLLTRNGFPRPRINALVRTAGKTYEVDFLYPKARLIIEADGDRYHGTRLARQADQAKQAALEAAGYTVLRLTWSQVKGRHQPQTLARIRNALDGAAPS